MDMFVQVEGLMLSLPLPKNLSKGPLSPLTKLNRALLNRTPFVPLIRMGNYIPARECLARFFRVDRSKNTVTNIEICFPDVLKYGREIITISNEMIEAGLEAPFREGMTEVNAEAILTGSGELVILSWL